MNNVPFIPFLARKSPLPPYTYCLTAERHR
jgi:hypothetical protein